MALPMTTYSELPSQLGFIKANWTAVIFSIYDRKAAFKELMMDGITVRKRKRSLNRNEQWC
ncbi:MAG: hypothetical protein ACJAXJ_001728 [Colwellia sp.]|jgi:hypothetical protein